MLRILRGDRPADRSGPRRGDAATSRTIDPNDPAHEPSLVDPKHQRIVRRYRYALSQLAVIKLAERSGRI